MKFQVTISVGEAIDRLSILKIKLDKVTDAVKREHIEAELVQYRLIEDEIVNSLEMPELHSYRQLADALIQVNLMLWEAEDTIRELSRKFSFGSSYIRVAQSIHQLNDQRFEYKQALNGLLKSDLVEEKIYAGS